MNTYSLPPCRKITHARDFTDIIQNGFRFSGALISVSYRQTEGPAARIGISVGRRYGSAVQRNRFKRLIRESFRTEQHRMPPVDMIVMPLLPRQKPELGAVMKDFTGFIGNVTREAI